MSRCILDNEEEGYQAVIGWDPGTGSFFAQVTELYGDTPFIWEGTDTQYQTSEDLQRLISKIQPYAIEFDPTIVAAELLNDQRDNSQRIYACRGTEVMG